MIRPVLASAALLLSGCAADDWGPDKLGWGSHDKAENTLRQGRHVYATYCVGCHGEQGDGNGPSAKFLDPKPRDFRVGRLKFASVAAGSTPHDVDFARVIRGGLAGTAMPAFHLLPPEELSPLIAYVRRFYTGDAEAPAAVVALPEDPWRDNPADGVKEGERVYHGLASCFTCHPAYVTPEQIVEHLKSFEIPSDGQFRPGLYDSVEKESEWGTNILPPNFLTQRVKFGTRREDLLQVIATGVGGTAMPSWGSGLTPEQLWGLAYYVESLVNIRGTPRAQELRAALLPLSPSADPSTAAAPAAAP